MTAFRRDLQKFRTPLIGTLVETWLFAEKACKLQAVSRTAAGMDLDLIALMAPIPSIEFITLTALKKFFK